jgi:hypothetical protein
MPLRFNPLSGQLDWIGDSGSSPSIPVAEKVADVFTCAATVAIGDLVVPSELVSGDVEALSSNVYNNLCFGVVISKPSLTTAEVLVSGKLLGLSGLPIGRPLFVGTSGQLTAIKPATGHLQTMGISITSSTAFLMPSLTKVIQS